MEWSLTLRRLPVLFETTTDLETRRSQIFDVKKDAYLDSKIDIVTEGKERPELNTAYAAPETELEKRLVDMFENFFGIKGIGIEDNFFELGGDSLKGMMLLKKIKNEFDVYIPLSAFFQGQTVKQISLVVDELKRCSSQGKKTSKIRI
jgi:phthiocerol/phenolphthiocerol synthesis type-I polyketide synthase E